jgi:hypothetical protein
MGFQILAVIAWLLQWNWSWEAIYYSYSWDSFIFPTFSFTRKMKMGENYEVGSDKKKISLLVLLVKVGETF